MKLLIAVPSNRDWKPQFAQRLADLRVNLAINGVDATQGIFHQSSMISLARERLVQAAKDGDFTHIFFIDDDMAFNLEAFHLLKSRNLDFVAANCVCRPPVKGVMEQGQFHLKPTATGLNGETVSSLGRTGVQQISRIGLAFCLIATSVLKDIEGAFPIVWDSERKNYSGEDHYFCEVLRLKGIKIHVDHDAARHVWHVGDFPFQENFMSISPVEYRD